MNRVASRFKKMMLASIGISILDIIVGVVFFLCNDFSNKVCSVIIGALILVHGLFYLIRYIYDGLGRKVFSIDVIFGVAAIIVGLFSMFNPIENLSMYLLLFGVGICIIGLDMLCYGIIFMSKHEETFPLITLMSLLVIIMGVLAILNPFKQFILTARLVSYFGIATGLFGCLYNNLFKRRTNAILAMYK